MRAVVQRVDHASVTVDEKITGEVQKGLLVLLGVAEGDTDKDLAYIIDKVCGMRIFEDEAGKMNLSVKDVGGAILAVSQFTLPPRQASVLYGGSSTGCGQRLL